MLLLLLACLVATPVSGWQPPAALPDRIQLEIRTFLGSDEVTQYTKVNVYRAGTRESALAPHLVPGTGLVLSVAPGMYDVQAIHQRDGHILNIRWAEQLLVIHYPDEAGAHLQVINFKFGFGALQVKPHGDLPLPAEWSASAFVTGDRTRQAGRPLKQERYSLFVLPAGRYDFLVQKGKQSWWLSDLEVPLDRTRLTQVPPAGSG